MLSPRARRIGGRACDLEAVVPALGRGSRDTAQSDRQRSVGPGQLDRRRRKVARPDRAPGVAVRPDGMTTGGQGGAYAGPYWLERSVRAAMVASFTFGMVFGAVIGFVIGAALAAAAWALIWCGAI